MTGIENEVPFNSNSFSIETSSDSSYSLSDEGDLSYKNIPTRYNEIFDLYLKLKKK